MLGAIIGDIVGSRFEFNPTNDYDFELFSDQCDFTDDTICTIAVADALLKGRAFGESLHDWCKRYPHPKGGYGGRFAQWVRSDNPQPYDSFGNGSAMRVSPVAWYYEDEDEMLRNAEYNRENETSSNLKTKRAKCLFFRFLFSLPFAGSKA
jgi:ADP-ribosylglycohydrolase